VTGTRLTPTHLSLAGFAIVLLLAWFCYRPALSGDFQLDDVSNLSGLQYVEDRKSLLDFILSGAAGPTGRPIALWSFGMQADEWQHGARAFLRVNVLIHILNAALLAWFLFQLTRAQGIDRDRSALVGFAAAGIWVLMPLLATASLLTVQRMTTLSATFALAGLVGYLLGRARIESHPQSSLIVMGISLVLGTSLATLTKESGLLLPLYVLAIEATLFTAPRAIAGAKWRILQGVFLVFPAVVVFVYLAFNLGYSEWAVAKRGFNGWERLLTEAEVLWVYLQKALLGIPSTLGIYQAAPEVSAGMRQPTTLIAVAGWLLVIGIAVVYRRRWPLFGFAVLWFITGHLLESTVLPLELYFEHRNYLPIVGPVYAVVAAMLLQSQLSRRIASVFLPTYMFLSAILLYQFAAMLGDPSASSRYWALRYPESVRAVTNMATYQLKEEGPVRALATLDEFVLRNPQYSYLRIQELNLRCLAMPAADHSAVVGQLHQSLPTSDFTLSAGTMLSQLFDTLVTRDCNEVDTQTLLGIADRLLANPRYAAVPGYVQFHYRLLAGVARRQDRLQDAIGYVEKAISVMPSSELNMMMVTALADAGDYQQAREFIDDALEAPPRNPVRAVKWARDLENLREYVDELERYSRTQE
jgi:tetratricopeptide (TPR) repeat protein